MTITLRALFLVTAVASAAPAFAAELVVLGIQPTRNQVGAARDTDIVVDFDRAVDPASLPPTAKTFIVFGDNTGPAAGTFALENGNLRVRFTPSDPFAAGEDVSVVLTKQLKAADGSFLRSAGYAWQFRAAVKPSSRTFSTLDVFGNHAGSRTTRIYGAQAVDLDNDGWIDLATINEVSSDVRVFPNLGDGTGLLGPMITPFAPTGSTPSPNLAGDFDLDGEADICTANDGSADVTVLLGNGDGTFAAGNEYHVGSNPRGMAVLEMNGDGYADIATANLGTDNVAVLLNNGSGGFLAATFFNGGGSSEYAMSAGDMNNDGIFDLVVGNQASQTVVVFRGNGNGTFTQIGMGDAGGLVWMIRLGDVNGDGNLDVSCGNGGSSDGSILFGNGSGGLGSPQILPMPGGVVATDLGDMDGDGDLDWMLSSYGAGVWHLFVNDGAGIFSFDQGFDAASNSSCATMFDFDGDGDLDLALSDEVSDLVMLEKNDYSGEPYCFGDGSELACPCANHSAPGAGEGCRNSTGVGGLLEGTGSASVVLDDFVLHATQLPLHQNGLVFAGLNAAQVPFGDGHRCIGGGIVRFSVKNSGSSGTITQSNVSSFLGLAVGQTRRFQGWFRDPMGPCGLAFNLTNGLAATFAP